MISFLHAAGLLFVLSAGVPVAIHLIHPKQTVVDVPSILLFTGMKKTSSRRRLREWILLLLRCLILAAAALVLAVPVFRNSAAHLPGMSAPDKTVPVLLLDDSPSALYSVNGKTLFELQKERFDRWLSGLKNESAVLIASAASGSVTLPMTPSEARDKLVRWKPRTRKGLLADAALSVERLPPSMRISSTALLAAIPPNPENLAALESRPSLNEKLNLIQFRDDDFRPDPWIASASVNSGTVEVHFGGNPALLARTRIRVSNADGLSDSHELPPDAQAQGMIKLPNSASKEESLRVSIECPEMPEKPLPFSEYFLPPETDSSEKQVLLVYDDSPESARAFLFLFTVFDSLKHTHPLRVTALDIHALPRIPPASAFSAAVFLPLAGTSPDAAPLLNRLLAAGTNVLLFPQKFPLGPVEWAPSAPGDGPLLPGAGEGLSPRFLTLYSKGFSQTRIHALARIVPADGDVPVYLVNGSPVLLFRKTSMPGTLSVFAVPMNPLPVSMLANPIFPQIVAALAGLENADLFHDSFPAGGTILLPSAFPGKFRKDSLIVRSPDGEQTLSCSENKPYALTLNTPGFASAESLDGLVKVPFTVNMPRGDVPGGTPTAGLWNPVTASDSLLRTKDAEAELSGRVEGERPAVAEAALILALLLLTETVFGSLCTIRKGRTGE